MALPAFSLNYLEGDRAVLGVASVVAVPLDPLDAGGAAGARRAQSDVEAVVLLLLRASDGARPGACSERGLYQVWRQLVGNVL